MPAFTFKDLQDLFIPGVGKVPRVPNRLKKGYLKKSVLTARWFSPKPRKQGEREMARRRRQIERGILKLN